MAQATDSKLISDNKLDAMVEILSTVGLEDPDHYGFRSHVQNPKNYDFGDFEWTERGPNMRFYIGLNFEKTAIDQVTVIVADGRKSTFSISEATIAQANRDLEALFA